MTKKEQEEKTGKEIIEKSIELLKRQGLKFSIDVLCAEMKLSKKTVYKYFADKEALATAMFRKIYDDLSEKSDVLLAGAEKGEREIRESLVLLRTALYFSDDGIFNRYSLNGKIGAYARTQTELVWTKTEKLLSACGLCAVGNPCFKKTAFAALKVLEEKDVGDFVRLISGGRI